MQQQVYECHMNSVAELKQRFISQSTAINEQRKWLTACMRAADGQHFKHLSDICTEKYCNWSTTVKVRLGGILFCNTVYK